MIPRNTAINKKHGTALSKISTLEQQRNQLITKYNNLVRSYNNKKINELQYKIFLARLMNGRSIESYLNHYDSEIKKYERIAQRIEEGKDIHSIIQKTTIPLAVIILSFAMIFTFMHQPETTGQIFKTMETGGSANLVCNVTPNCSYYDILHISNTTDAHAELASGTNYSHSLCCYDSGPNNATLTSGCGTAYLHLSNTTDAHVEKITESYYSHNACISSASANFICGYETVSCTGYDTCLVSISTNISGNDTNLQIADCTTDPYETFVCCNMTYTEETVIPTYSGFSQTAGTTNFSEVSDLMAAYNVTLAKADGKIKFPASHALYAENENYDTNINISFNLIHVTTSSLHSTFNSSAELTLYNLTFAQPQILRDGQSCSSPDCVIISYNASSGELVFNVSHFTAYSASEDVNLTIWDDTDSVEKDTGDEVMFFANYTYTNHTTIDNSTGDCEIAFNISGWSAFNSMQYNATSKLWQYNRSIDTRGIHLFNISCTGPENLSAVDDMNITNAPPGIPSLLTPADNANVTNRTLKLTWNASTDADNDTVTYDLIINRIYCNDPDYCDVSVINETGLTAAEYTTEMLDVDAAYNWSVKAYDGLEYSNWTTFRNFTVIPLIDIRIMFLLQI